MASYLDSYITAELRAAAETLVKEQLDRHRSIDPNVDPKKIVGLAIRMKQESLRQKLDCLLDSEEFAGDDEFQIVQLRHLIDEVLPELERRIKKTY
jgi:hypothetical protein